jgi:hypothetical protein
MSERKPILKDLLLETFTTFIQPLIFWENHRQHRKWGVQNHDPATWMMILSEEHGELAQALLQYQYEDGDIDKVIKEAVQTATLAAKIAEMFLAERCTNHISIGSGNLARQILGE